MDGVGDGFGGDVVDVVGIAMKLEAMFTDDLAMGEDVENKEGKH